MPQPAVSVIIPTFNRLAYLREALDSVAAQSWRDFEVIVIDDGSDTDIAEEISRHTTRPKVVRQSHQGPAAARNRGLAEASAEVIAFLDSDDLWLPTKLEKFMQAMEGHPSCSIFYGPMEPIDYRKNPVAGRTKRCYTGWITEKLFCSSFVHVPTVVCKKKMLRDAKGFDCTLPVCEDYDLWLRLSARQPFVLIEEPLAMRRLHQNRLSKARMARNLAVKSRVLQQFYDSDLANGNLRPRVARCRLARVHFAASRAAFREGHYQQAVQLCRQSRQLGCSSLRTIPLIATASTLALLGPEKHPLTTSR